MDVQETTIRQLLEGSKQYAVPLYQRPYAWGRRQRTRLWRDVLALERTRRTSPAATHFMGSLVLSSGRIGPSGVEFLVVDGQQRLTTLSILLCALRDHLRAHRPDEPMLAASIHEQFVADRYKAGDERLKLLPSQADRGPYCAVVDGVAADEQSAVRAAYDDFRQALDAADGADEVGEPHFVERIRDAVLGGLAFVSITAKGDDDVYRIFESINNTGVQLTQGDLIRNHLFMRLGPDGAAVYASWWLPMQERLSSEDLELLFWLDAVATNPAVKQSEIHAFQQARLADLDDQAVTAEVVRFSRLSELLAVVRHPQREPDEAVRERLTRLQEWGSPTTVPITLRLLARRASGHSDSAEVAAALGVVESFLVRRAVAGRPGDGASRALLRACSILEDPDQPAADGVLGIGDAATVRAALSTGRRQFIDDDRVRAAVLDEPYYLRGRRPHQKLILAWIERTLRPREPVDVGRATVEHVLPQRMSADWRSALQRGLRPGESVDEVHDRLVHTLGNLTLTGSNGELGNQPFEWKRAEFAVSGFEMNRRIAEHEVWGAEEIRARGRWLADRICAEWIGPDTGASTSGTRWEVVHEAIAAVPPGRWTSFGDLASLVGTHPVPVGQHLASELVPGAHRVLHAPGTIPPASRWSTADGRDVRGVLTDEGVLFDPRTGRASQGQRIRSAALAARLATARGPAP
ncbi:alkylated DNA nucleotide flippase Atl1 [Curtobacterium luteum]|uniref:Alkylated DNA nucleotide flippase Atl1 n=1 Tax=Curtobacterium luteum TaxID=33881 RepID=A0A8H9KYK4_9MICO|nr:DUF262 domain-containing protein [Curtobacterium luteum]MBM7801117.1 alkylated DNA nucleotide flippase Atl1 [Curtobacterium luteum]NUU52484.1 DUF262 domain-containing protein [Curtobacterium luteum]GGK96710.1 hypothetical protein GCM10009769_13560 [Curtobacterium luteum]